MKYLWTKKYDKAWLGLTLGLLFPILGFIISFLIKGGESSFANYWYMFIKDYSATTGETINIYSANRQDIILFCLLSNMALFYPTFFIWKMNRFSKGTVGTTLILAVIAFIYIIN